MSISVTTSKLVSLLLISLLTITRSSDRSDTIRQFVSPLTLVNDSSSALAIPAEIVMSQLAGATSSMIQSPQPNESIFSTASRCFMDTFEDNRRSIFDFNSFTPYIVILVAGLSFFFFNPSLIVKFIVLKQVLPTLACSIAPVSLLSVFSITPYNLNPYPFFK